MTDFKGDKLIARQTRFKETTRRLFSHDREGSCMDHNVVLELETACERAIAEVLRKHYPHEVLHRVRHLMAKAAVAVLEAVDEAKTED
jgi:hypothetical protein